MVATITNPGQVLGKVRVGDGCWEWTGSRITRGYGNVKIRGKGWMAHRAVYTLLVGPIGEGLTLDHLCRNHGCVRPSHLEPVPLAENILRGTGFAARNAAKKVGKCGHPLTRFQNDGRRCRPCHNEYHRVWWRAHRNENG